MNNSKQLQKVIAGILLLLVSVTGFYGCKKEDVKAQSVKPIDYLKSDHRSITILENNLNLINNIKDLKRAKDIIDETNPSIVELEELSKLLGFENLLKYKQYINAENKVLNQLKIEYNLSVYKQGDIIKSLNPKSNLLNASTSETVMLVADNCERIRRNCLIGVAATATAAHLACTAADLTVIGGIVCHAAAIVYQAVAGDNCNAEAENCEEALID